MYIGSKGNVGWKACIREIFQNSVDEMIRKESPCHYVKLTFDYSLFFTDNLAMNFGLYLGYDTPLYATKSGAGNSYFTTFGMDGVWIHDFNVGLQLGFRFGPKA